MKLENEELKQTKQQNKHYECKIRELEAKNNAIFKITQLGNITSRDLPEIDEKLKMTNPIAREWIIEYFEYYGLTLAQEALKIKDVDWIRYRDWWYMVLAALLQVFRWLKLSKDNKKK